MVRSKHRIQPMDALLKRKLLPTSPSLRIKRGKSTLPIGSKWGITLDKLLI
jgi:hypothetical protein